MGFNGIAGPGGGARKLPGKLRAFKISNQEEKRIYYHCQRLSWPEAEIIRLAIHKFLNELDEEEETFFRREAERHARTHKKKSMLPGVTDSGASGMALPKTQAWKSQKKDAIRDQHKKLEHSFPTYLKLVDESAEKGAVERAKTLNHIGQQMRERSGTEIGDIMFAKFVKLLDAKQKHAPPISLEGVDVETDDDVDVVESEED